MADDIRICPVVDRDGPCGRRTATRGLCNKHYLRLLKHGDPTVTHGRGGRAPSEALCKIVGCPELARGRGWCKGHWQTWRRTGDPLGSLRPADPAPEGHKTCATCHTAKPLDDFRSHPEGRLGRMAHCKPCYSEYTTRRYWADPEQARAKSRAHVAAHHEEVIARRRELYQKNADRERKRSAQWAKTNREKLRLGQRERYRTDPIRRAIVQARAAEQRARLAGKTMSAGLVMRELVLDRDGGICGLCGGSVDPANYHVDHIIPLSRGGEHTYANVQIAHPFCNTSKGNRIAA